MKGMITKLSTMNSETLETECRRMANNYRVKGTKEI